MQGRKIDLRGVFKYTTLLLVFLSAGMIAYGTHEAEEYLVKSEQIEKSDIYRVWDILEPTQSAETGKTIYHPLHDKGSVGLFLKGFFGYNSNPNIPEVILWFLAMLFGLNMWRRFYY
jgi:high-affinity iron transporter